MQNLPIITNPQDVSIYQVERKSIFRYLKQFEELFEKETGSKELSLFLAEPEVNDFTKQISWSTKAEGPIRNMSQLSPEERVYVAGRIQEYTDQIRVIANKLAVTKGLSTFITAEILDNLLVTRELPEAIFLVGNQVVMTEWGCAPYGRYDRKNFALTKQITKIDPTYIAPVVVEPTIVPVEDIVAATPARSLWRWLVILLLASLLVFGLSLKSCSRFNTVDNGAEESALRAEINSLWIQVKEKAEANHCYPKNEEGTSNSGCNPGNSGTTINETEWKKNDLNVFNGNWKLITSLLNAKTNEQIIIEFLFNSSGRGAAFIRQKSGDCQSPATVYFDSKEEANRKFTVFANQFSCASSNGMVMSGDSKVTCQVRPDFQKADCNLICRDGACSGVFERQ